MAYTANAVGIRHARVQTEVLTKHQDAMKDKNETINVAAGSVSVEQHEPDEVVITIAASKDRTENVTLKIVNSDTHDFVNLTWPGSTNPK